MGNDAWGQYFIGSLRSYRFKHINSNYCPCCLGAIGLNRVEASLMWCQKEFFLSAKPRGFHLITDEVLAEIPESQGLACGLLHLFIKHTSASLTINENADPTVRQDLESHFNHAVPERATYYQHDYEGDDDMPAHIKSSLLGASVSIPITGGKLNLGIWQGIYLCEHRNHGGQRKLVATLYGQAQHDGSNLFAEGCKL